MRRKSGDKGYFKEGWTLKPLAVRVSISGPQTVNRIDLTPLSTYIETFWCKPTLFSFPLVPNLFLVTLVLTIC